MKKIFKVLMLILIIILVLIVILFLFLLYASKQPAVKSDYYKNVVSEKPLEQKYTNRGTYEVSYLEYKSENEKIGQFKIWYPAVLESSEEAFPLVVMANGTGVKASRYEAIFDHLASWGFIVIGNEDESSWDGISSSESLNLMLNMNNDSASVFYNKVDIGNIGVAGHSQGGVGAINSVTAHENGSYYKTIYTASATHIVLAEGLKWTYDVSKINIPYFMVAGTLKIDAGDGIEGSSNVGISPLFSLNENYDEISDNVFKIMARRVNADHGDMLSYADGYMTAWFMYHLKGDEEAGRVFIGENAEILTNSNWQDVNKNR
ncbi:MAG: alpha/beta hydrolase [Oscillospiraceae bacterium]